MSSAKSARFYQKIQSISGIIFSTFVCVHLTNHVMAIFGGSMDLHTKYLNSARLFYRNPLIEAGLLLSLVVHIFCALRGIWTRPQIGPNYFDPRRYMAKIIPWSLDNSRKVHRIIGYVLTVIMVGHIMAFRIVPQLVLGYNNMNKIDGRIVTADLTLKPQVFIPYLIIVFVGGVYHTLHGYHLTCQRLFGKRIAGPPWLWVGLVAFVIACGVVAGIGGFLYKIDIPWQDIDPILIKLHLKQ